MGHVMGSSHDERIAPSPARFASHAVGELAVAAGAQAASGRSYEARAIPRQRWPRQPTASGPDAGGCCELLAVRVLLERWRGSADLFWSDRTVWVTAIGANRRCPRVSASAGPDRCLLLES